MLISVPTKLLEKDRLNRSLSINLISITICVVGTIIIIMKPKYLAI